MKRSLLKLKDRLTLTVTLIVVLALVGGAGIAIAQYLFEREQQATIKVLTTELGIFEDAGCTVPFPVDILDFGVIEKTWPLDPPSVSSGSVQFYLKNLGDTGLYLKLWQAGIGTDLSLVEAFYGVIGDDVAPLLFPTGDWTVEATATILAGYPLSAEDTYGICLAANGAAGWYAPGVVKIDSEYIRYETVELSGGWLMSLVRGLYGSTPAEHLAGATVDRGLMTGVLASGEVIAIDFHMEAGEAPASGVDDFFIYINAKASPW